MLTLKNLLTQADLAKKVVEIKTTAHNLQASIELCACSGLDHVRAHGDTTGVLALMNALPNGQRVKALAFWFKKFSNSKLIFTMDKKAKEWKVSLSKQRVDADFDITGAMATSFADLTDERDPKSATVESILKSLISKSTNTENFDGTDIPKVEPAARELTAKLIAYARSIGYDQKEAKSATPAPAAA